MSINNKKLQSQKDLTKERQLFECLLQLDKEFGFILFVLVDFINVLYNCSITAPFQNVAYYTIVITFTT
jgi:hypothetical protein